jgi:hypothetical protein
MVPTEVIQVVWFGLEEEAVEGREGNSAVVVIFYRNIEFFLR